MEEPKIVINGVELSRGQAMTVRVAIQSFAISLEPLDALGSDMHAEVMRDGYRRNITEINEIIGKH